MWMACRRLSLLYITLLIHSSFASTAHSIEPDELLKQYSSFTEHAYARIAYISYVETLLTAPKPDDRNTMYRESFDIQLWRRDGELDITRTTLLQRQVDAEDQESYAEIGKNIARNILTTSSWYNWKAYSEGIDDQSLAISYQPEQHRQPIIQGAVESMLFSGWTGGFDNQSIADVLGSDGVQLRAENLTTYPAITVLHGETRYGDIELWLDETKGFLPSRIVVEKKMDDLHFGMALTNFTTFGENVSSFRLVGKVIDWQEVNGTFYPARATVEKTYTYQDAPPWEHFIELNFDEYDTNPDYDSAGAFELDFANGVRVFLLDIDTGLQYQWLNGKTIPVFDKEILNSLELNLRETTGQPNDDTIDKQIFIDSDVRTTSSNKTSPLIPPSEQNIIPIIALVILVTTIAITIGMVFARRNR